ncbi:LuxR C-terminal-related transcriptional regulator [Streptomyces durmitorensis]|uniref:Helix-turn-helix transcriptional regulator n=1 Tax=Streptomyces durmitorensis TaxID=319947 RepID=A0ABY4PWL2_9ACTN|nr:helix-turn-helix transcriptional regulator [Streptomyces durmitorensis]UQT57351.1 helix-turn-helix transcriptional regulator [Streptomyces durmitorensis]
MSVEHIPHGVEQLCEQGSAAYIRALSEGRIRSEDVAQAPCLVDFGLLHPDISDMQWLHPTAPAVALPRLLRVIEDHITDQRQREERLTAAFEPLMALDPRLSTASDNPAITVLDGLERINAAIDQAISDTQEEFLAVQPGGTRPPETLADAFARDQALLSRGCRMRTLYQHTTRHSLPVLAYLERLEGDAEARTLDEVTERLFVFDRTVAFIPASKDRSLALELRHPAVVEYLATTFDRLWRLATPMWPQSAPQPADDGVTARQRAIAALLVEGHTDSEVAASLGMNVRTARVHIAKLAVGVGSHSRAQLGYRIGQSGILDQKR